MPITAADLKFFASAKMTDDADAGGSRAGTALQDGGVNNVFPDTTEADRTTGSTRLRKVYPSVVSSEQSALLGATVGINDMPSDPAISAAIFKYGDDTTKRSTVETAIKASLTLGSVTTTDSIANPLGSGLFDGGTNLLEVLGRNLGGSIGFVVGSTVAVTVAGVTTLHRVTAVANGAANAWDVTVEPALPGVATGVSCAVRRPLFGDLRPYSTVETAAALISATTLDLDSLWCRVVPVNPAVAYPAVEQATGIGSGWAQYTHGQLECVRAGDQAVLWDEDETAPDTVANLDTTDCGRTDLAQATVVDANGDEIARFLKYGEVPAGVGCTANLTTGIITYTDVSGFAQPVTVRHRIAETVGIQSLDGLTATLTGALSRAFPATSKLTTLAPYGDMQTSLGVMFSQQAWTKTFSDSLIGSAAPTMYSGSVGLTNDGAEADRYACVFTTSTQFNFISEKFGQIATGNRGTDFTPLNPINSQPLCTLYAAAWGTTGVGNVLRFNTTGSYGRTWALRSVYPSTETGSDSVVLRLRGGV